MAGGNLSYSAENLAAVGNSAVGIFGGGWAYLSITSIYNYSTNVSMAGGNLSYTEGLEAAVGNGTIGVFGGGTGKTSTTSI